MRLEIEVGQKAVAIAGHVHRFQDGEEIEFLEYGRSIVEENYYEYTFVSTSDNLKQHLVSNEFELEELK